MKAVMPGPLSRRAIGFDRWLGVILLASFAALIAGLLLPAITIRSIFIGRDFSLLDSVVAFGEQGDWFLFILTFVFTIVFPLFKTVTGLALWFVVDATGSFARPVLGWLSALSKWSMLDVFIIALIVLVADGRLLSSADIQIGAVAFSAAVLVSTWATRRLSLLAGN